MKKYQVEIAIALIIYIALCIVAIYYCIQAVFVHDYLSAVSRGILPLLMLSLFDIFQRRYQRAKKKQEAAQQISPEEIKNTIEPGKV